MANDMKSVAILDMNAGYPNMGLQSIVNLVTSFEDQLTHKVFEVRRNAEIPSLDYDIYICSGGPGSPLEEGHGEKAFFDFMQRLWDWNQLPSNPKKYALFICHSFQMACHFFEVGKIKKRKSPSFGIFPTHKTDAGREEFLFKKLPDPFYIADFRSWQVVQPNWTRLEQMNGHILTIEKERPDVNLERAIMAIRFSPELIGVQFHPEAHPEGMLIHFSEDARKNTVINEHGLEKYEQMIADMKHPDRIALTCKTVIPEFLKQSIKQINNATQPFDLVV